MQYFQVNDHLNEGGIFILISGMDPAVLTDPPRSTTKQLEDEYVKIIRTARIFYKCSKKYC